MTTNANPEDVLADLNSHRRARKVEKDAAQMRAIHVAKTSPESVEQALVPTDPDARKRYFDDRERKLARAALAARCDAFAKAARAGSDKEAAKLFLAEVGAQERLALLRSMDAEQLIELARRAPAALREAIVAAHPDRPLIERLLVPADKIPRWKVATLAIGWHQTPAREVSPAEARSLRNSGAGRYLQEVGRRPQGAPQLYLGLSLQGAMTFPAAALEALLAVDADLRRLVDSGALVVEDEPVDLSRYRLSVEDVRAALAPADVDEDA